MQTHAQANQSKHDHMELLSNLNSSWPAAKTSPNPPQTHPKPSKNPSQTLPRAPQERPRASRSAHKRPRAPNKRPKGPQERPSAARTLPKTALNRAQIATKTNFYALLSLSLFNSNSLSILFAIFRISFMSPTLNFIGFLEGKRYFSPNRYFRSTSKKSPKILAKTCQNPSPNPPQTSKNRSETPQKCTKNAR